MQQNSNPFLSQEASNPFLSQEARKPGSQEPRNPYSAHEDEPFSRMGYGITMVDSETYVEDVNLILTLEFAPVISKFRE
jgi:hypothetical protein